MDTPPRRMRLMFRICNPAESSSWEIKLVRVPFSATRSRVSFCQLTFSGVEPRLSRLIPSGDWLLAGIARDFHHEFMFHRGGVIGQFAHNSPVLGPHHKSACVGIQRCAGGELLEMHFQRLHA